MDEPDVVEKLAEYLDTRNYSFFVDSGYGSNRVDRLESRFENCSMNNTMTIEGRIPDIIGVSPQNHVIAIEAKGESDIRKGIGQGAHYRQGVHKSFLAADADALEEFEDTALSCGLGAISVTSNDVVVTQPPKNIAATKLEQTRRALSVKTSRFESAQTTFPSMTRPENAFFPLLAIQEQSANGALSLSDCKEAIKTNPDGYQQASSAISLACTLQLVRKPTRDRVEITDSGRSCYYLLKGLAGPDSIDDVYQYVSGLKQNRILHNENPEITSFLRDRYLSVPDIRLLVYVLASYDGNKGELSRILSEIALASPDTFLNLFCGRGMGSEFRDLVEDRRPSVDDEKFRSEILDLTSSNALYNFVYQIRTIGILDEDTDAVHQSADLEIGEFYWHWDRNMVGQMEGDLRT